ncbi:esterase-like activity of phytase family protein [Dyadobacter luticola]|uniref:Esterase-like activity of phytase family protein n=1 Tax=Dyadobacter luticola TaxID=1979387 RepID=A0A5R9KVM5_9BACT|nr:esterase-like activity of phytase family protein [Dyadobacter luticola]TLV00139.1 esterase-like activity of phytase family protein [Dyadobacter luticola]
MNKAIYVWFAVKTLLCTCQPDQRTNDFRKVRSHYKISKIGKLPSQASESSGLARAGGKSTFWTHNDSGGKPELYEFDLTGKLISTKSIPGTQNVDWEDLAQDPSGNIYIGDFGNNAGTRKSLDIYKYNPTASTTEKISFQYPFKKVDKDAPNDFEAFFYHDQKLWLFSKNWGKDKFVKVYTLPAEKGTYKLTPVDSIQVSSQVTSADMSPDGKTFALLTYGKVLTFEVSGEEINFKKPVGCFRLVKKQSEALIFLNNTDMLITNEQGDFYKITYQ